MEDSLQDNLEDNACFDDKERTKRVIERLKIFVPYFVNKFEEKIKSCFDEATGETEKIPKTAKHIGKAIDMVADGILGAKVAKTCIIWFGKRIHKDKAKSVTKTISEVTQHEEEDRELLVNVGIKIFQSFESQYMNHYGGAGWKAAMKSIAVNAVERIVNYLKKYEENQDEISLHDLITKGIIFGQSKGAVLNGIFMKSDLIEMYKNVGLVIINKDGIYNYYKNKILNKKPEQYGYRLIFEWEKSDLAKKLEDFVEDQPEKDYKYVLKAEDTENIFKEILEEINMNDLNIINKKIDEIYKHVVVAEKKNEPVWFHKIQTNIYFTGRQDELKDINKHLDEKKIVVINGFSGVGKSQLASKYAHKNYGGYSALWINAETCKTTNNSFINLYNKIYAEKLKKKKTNEEDEESIKSIIEDVYKYFSGLKCLIIFENAEKYSTIRDFLPSSVLSTNANKPDIIITSSSNVWNEDMAQEPLYNLKLDIFSKPEAMSFVKKCLKVEDNLQDGDIKKFIEELYYFPLALQQAVAYIKDEDTKKKVFNKQFTTIDYMNEYNNKKAKTLLESDKFLDNDKYDQTTYTVLQIVLDKIKEDQELQKCCLDILHVIAFFTPDSIPVELLLRLNNNNENQTASAILLLQKYFIIVEGDGGWNVHGLIQKAIRLEIENKEEQCLENALLLLKFYKTTKSCKPHIISAWNYACKYQKLISTFIDRKKQKRYTTYFHLIAEGCKNNTIETIINALDPERIESIINFKDTKNNTSLHFAASNSDEKVLEILIKNGGDINVKSKINWTPLHCASRYGQLKNVKLLLQNKADIEAKTGYEFTPLHLAARFGYPEITELLLDYRANVNSKDQFKFTPLHFAVQKNHTEVVNILFNSNSIELSAQTNQARTPLHFAAQTGAVDIINILLEKDCDVNIKDNHHFTPLHWAVLNNHIDAVLILLKNNKIIINNQTTQGNTVLHLAAENDYKEIIKILFENQIDVNIKNEKGKLAVDLAENKEYFRYCKFNS